MAAAEPPQRCVIVGGGRWARVVIRELLGVLPPATAVAIVSPSAADAMGDWVAIDDATRRYAGRIEVRRDLPGGVEGDADIAVVVNRPAQHHAVAAALLERGYHVLVEKPFTTDPEQARDLVVLGAKRGRVVAAGLVFLAAGYMHDFRRRLNFDPATTASVEIQWEDPIVETRYGEAKRASADIGIAMDVLPHVWSILQAIFGAGVPLELRLASADRDRRAITVAGAAGSARMTAVLNRAGTARRRVLALSGPNGAAARDFAGDPVLATLGRAPPVPLPVADIEGRPMARLLGGFIDFVRRRDSDAAWRHGVVLGPAIIRHIELICGVERALSAR
ncbi:MAG: Gfo/Idh/MocA family oxidoreductase [Rhodospirillales bacterium]